MTKNLFSRPVLSAWVFRTALLLLVIATPLAAQPRPATGHFENLVYRDDDGDHKYTVFLPAGFRADRKYPVILFLHGAGERGSDGHKQLTVGLAPYVKAKAATFPFVVVFPQCEDLEGRLLTSWTAETSDAHRALKILDDVQMKFHTDPQRTVLVGWSMGGYGAWSVAAADPERWSAVVILDGGADPNTAAKLKDVPVWVFHGAKDKLVPVAEGRNAVEALKSAGGKVTYTEFPEIGHAPFEETFPNDGLIRWMLDPKKAPAKLTNQPVHVKPLVPPGPFVPALEIPQAVGVRLGNDALHALSYAAPKLVPAGMLSGSIADMYDSTEAAGRQFQVTFSGIRYVGQLERAYVKAYAADRVTVQLGLRNVTMTIGGTYISGARHSAQAGPINIGIGHRAPVWLALDVTPSVVQRKLKLRLNGVNFQIPPDNFSISPPAGVSTQGFGMTQDRVVSSLTSGLYGSRGRIENEVRNIAPNIVRELEHQLNLSLDTSAILSGLWPLPVYEPQMKVWPENIIVDKNGVSLVMGVVGGQPDPFAPPKPLQKADPVGVTSASLGTGTALDVAMSPQVLGPLTNLLIADDLAIINVLDIPEKSFARLADPKELTPIIPDLARYGEALQTRAVLRLAAPLESGANDGKLQFRLPKLLVTVSVNTDAADPHWKHCVDFELDLRQHVEPSLEKPSFVRREVLLGWKPDETVTGTSHFAEGYQSENMMIDTEKFVELFRDSWNKWTQQDSPAGTVAPDLTLGDVHLRMDKLGWVDPLITATFKSAGIKITNSSDEPFTYEARGPFSGYGGPYTLKPGLSHEFDIAYPLTYRRQARGVSEVYTLSSGMHLEFRVPQTGGKPRLFQAKEP